MTNFARRDNISFPWALFTGVVAAVLVIAATSPSAYRYKGHTYKVGLFNGAYHGMVYLKRERQWGVMNEGYNTRELAVESAKLFIDYLAG